MSNSIIHTHAQITSSENAQEIVNIRSTEVLHDILIVLTQQEFTNKIKRWLRSLPMEQRQLILDELTACTLRTLE